MSVADSFLLSSLALVFPRQIGDWELDLRQMIGWSSSMRTLRLALSLSLVVWVSGAGCAFGCETLAMAAADHGAAATDHSQAQLDSSTMVSGDACASAADHSCCAKHHRSSAQSLKGHSEKRPRAGRALGSNSVANPDVATSSMMLAVLDGAMQACPLAMNGTALATKARTDESTNSVALAPVTLPAIDLEKPLASSPPTFFNNRGHTYLRCCVFLI